MELIRLVTGEEVIAKIKEETDTTLTVEDGIMLIPAGEGKIGMVPFMPYSEGDPIELNKAHIMFRTTPNEDLRRQVLRITTGIETPNAGLSIIT